MHKGILAISAMLLALALVAACGGEEEEEKGGPTAGAAAPSGVVEVEAHDFYFEPAQLTAEVGRALVVEVKNEGQATHTFTIDELNVDVTLNPGEEAAVSFSPSQSGTLAFYCRFHRSRGMEGILDVSGGSSEAAPGGPTSTPTSGTPSQGYGY